MPATIGALALAAVAIGGYLWPEALLIGAALAPTDPVLASAVGSRSRSCSWRWRSAEASR